MLKNKKEKKKKFKMPTAFTILFFILVFLVLLSLILHWCGITTTYDTQKIDEWGNPIWKADGQPDMEPVTKTIVGLGIVDVFLAIANGFLSKASVIIFIMSLGGFIFLVLKSKALEGLTQKLVNKMKDKAIWLIPVLMTMFSFLGSTYGMAEESLGFYMLIIPLIVAAGFDTFTGMMIVLLGAGTGCLASTVNPFVVSLAADASNGAINGGAGMGFRWLSWVLFTLLGIGFVVLYARRVKFNPQKSVTFATADADKQFFLGSGQEEIKLTKKRIFINVVFFITFIIMVLYLVDWDTLLSSTGAGDAGTWMNDHLYFITALMPGFGHAGLAEVAVFFLISALIVGTLSWEGEAQFTSDMVDGARDMLGVCLVIAVAGGVGYLLEKSLMQPLFVNGLSDSIGSISNVSLFLIVSFLLFLPLSFLIPSTSGFAAAIFPIYGPVAAGVGSAAGMGSIMSFSYASGVLNLFTPTSGVVMGAIAISHVNFGQLLKGTWPYILSTIGLSIALLGLGPVMGNLLG